MPAAAGASADHWPTAERGAWPLRASRPEDSLGTPRGSLGTGPRAHVAAVTATGGQAPADRAPWVPWEARQRPTCSPRGRRVRAGLPEGSSAGAAPPPGRLGLGGQAGPPRRGTSPPPGLNSDPGPQAGAVGPRGSSRPGPGAPTLHPAPFAPLPRTCSENGGGSDLPASRLFSFLRFVSRSRLIADLHFRLENGAEAGPLQPAAGRGRGGARGGTATLAASWPGPGATRPPPSPPGVGASTPALWVRSALHAVLRLLPPHVSGCPCLALEPLPESSVSPCLPEPESPSWSLGPLPEPTGCQGSPQTWLLCVVLTSALRSCSICVCLKIVTGRSSRHPRALLPGGQDDGRGTLTALAWPGVRTLPFPSGHLLFTFCWCGGVVTA